MSRMLDAVGAIISPVYLVGGSVRDGLLGRKVSDYDFATPLTPDAIEAAVRAAGRKPYLTGKRFGTVGFKIDGAFVEVTSFRGELYDKGSRKPAVSFDATFEDDLARRDFTINAMAQTQSGEVIDLFGGKDDLDARLIKAVGDPMERFIDDPLRILRAARFASQLEFMIEERTLQAMKICSSALRHVAIQRSSKELDLLLIGPGASQGLRYMRDTDVLELFLPELVPQIPHGYFENTLTRVNNSEPVIETRWAALLKTVELPYIGSEDDLEESESDAAAYVRRGFVEKIGSYLRWSNARITAVRDSL